VFIIKKIFLSTLFSIFLFSSCFAEGLADTDVLDANQHVIMFEKGLDAFMAGDYEKCDDYWLPLARAGDPMAARNVALLYHQGKGVRQDLEEAELYYRIAADNGVTEAQTVLGTLLIKGDEFERDIPEAIKYLTAAYRAGDPIAAWNLGLLYENGIEVNKNMEKALSLFQMAARAGHEPALIRVSGKSEDSFQEPQKLKTIVDTAINSDDSFNKPLMQDKSDSAALDTQMPNAPHVDPVDPVDRTPKTYQERVDSDKEHDKKHYSDQLHFNKELQSDDTNKAILKDNRALYEKKQVGISKEIAPYDLHKSKVNRMQEPLDISQLSDDVILLKADQAYNQQDYTLAQKIWLAAFDKTKNDEAAYRLGMLYFTGQGVKKDTFKSYYYWKKGANANGKKSLYALEEFRSTLSDKALLDYEQKVP